MDTVKSFDQYDSLWQWTRDRSSYHFDKWRRETPGEFFRVLGRITPSWQQEVDDIKRLSVSRTWADITYSSQNQRPISTEKRRRDIVKGGGNLDSIQLTDTFDDFSQFPQLQKTIDWFGMDRVQARCHVQHTGQMFTIHIDPLHGIFSTKSYNDPNEQPEYVDRILRITVMLEDWEPGQFKIFGNEVYQQWKAGDYYIHDWPNVPHATANASEKMRPTLQITGLRTAITDAIIGHQLFTKE